MKDYTVVLSVFDDEAAADSAAAAIKASGLAPHEAVGILVLDESGGIKTEKVGARTDGKAAVEVLAQVGGAEAVLAELTALGGVAESHPLYSDDLGETRGAVGPLRSRRHT